jgi:hypothetical protein
VNALILDHKANGVHVIDKCGYFHYVLGYAEVPIGYEIEIPAESDAEGNAESDAEVDAESNAECNAESDADEEPHDPCTSCGQN